MSDEVILVNESDEAVGTMEKLEAHRRALLHRAFSIFIFNRQDEMLIQQRSDSKYHSAGLWTNACCSHPFPGEETDAAATRRLQEELGFNTTLAKIFDFTYRSEYDNGLTENEFDHVYVGVYDGDIHPNPNEIKDVAFKSIEQLSLELASEPERFTSWFRLAFPLIKSWVEAGKRTQEVKNDIKE